MNIEVAGENALIIYFGDKTSPLISTKVQTACVQLEATLGDKLIDLIPSYASLLVIYDALRCDHLWVKQRIQKAIPQGDVEIANSTTAGKTVELPVWYSPESGPDLTALAERTGLSVDTVISLHQSREYRVYAIGFAPGFAYLGEVDERIAAPRLANPRLKVPRGAVAIADQQTAVYPDVSPGGWNLIGLCPTRMFDPQAVPTMPVEVGDRVRFRAVSRDKFLELGGIAPC